MITIRRSEILVTVLLLLPIAPAPGQRIERIAATQVPVHSATSGSPQGRVSNNTGARVAMGVTIGAASGAILGLTAYALRTLPGAVACDVRNSVTSMSVGDVGPHTCRRSAKRRDQYVWTGAVTGGAVGGLVGRLVRFRADTVASDQASSAAASRRRSLRW